MELYKPKYETYQDVKNNIEYWSRPIWFLLGITVWFGFLSGEQRKTIIDFVPFLNNWITRVGFVSIGALLSIIISHIMIHIIEIHDHIYDRYFVKWRKKFNAEVIVPKLIKPYCENADEIKLFSVANENISDFLGNLFYRFVGDRDTKIRTNLLVRTYEALSNNPQGRVARACPWVNVRRRYAIL